MNFDLRTTAADGSMHMLNAVEPGTVKKRSISTHPKRGYPFTFLTSSSYWRCKFNHFSVTSLLFVDFFFRKLSILTSCV